MGLLSESLAGRLESEPDCGAVTAPGLTRAAAAAAAAVAAAPRPSGAARAPPSAVECAAGAPHANTGASGAARNPPRLASVTRTATGPRLPLSGRCGGPG